MSGLKTAGPIQFHFAVLLSLFLLFSCAKGKDDTEGEDRSIPAVESIVPDNAATGFSTTGSITITFSKPIDKQTFTTDSDGQCSKNVQVSTDSFNTCLKLESTPDVPSKVWTLKPDTNKNKFPSGTTISIKIKKDIKDGYGTAMEADKSSAFTTETHCSTSSDCSWSQVTTVGDLTGRSGHSGLVFDKKMWVFGGYDNDSGFFKDVLSSPDTTSSTVGKWDNQTTVTVWSARDKHISLPYLGKMWVIGGKNSNYSNGINEVWSSSTGLTWDNQTLTNAFSTRLGHAGVVFKNKMWILGGRSENNFLNDVYSSSDGTNWTQESSSSSWSGRYGHSAVVYSDKIWIIGGDNGTSGNLNEVWNSSDGINWNQQTSLDNTTKNHSSVVFDGKIWVIGGDDSDGSPQRRYFTYDGSNWSSLLSPEKSDGSIAWSQRSSTLTLIFDNYLWVIGGYKGETSEKVLADVWKYGKP